MDRIDRKIIDILQTNARAPLKEIADRVFLSSPAVSARIAKLEKDGVLTGYQAQVAPLKLGQRPPWRRRWLPENPAYWVWAAAYTAVRAAAGGSRCPQNPRA